MKLTPINSAEAITDPFWDPHFKTLDDWSITPGADYGLGVEQLWSWTAFSWLQRPDCGPALCMSRRYDMDVSEYDTLMASMVLPPATRLKICVDADVGDRVIEYARYDDDRKEYFVDLCGAKRIRSVTLEISASSDESASGWINWIGLRSSDRIESYRRQWAVDESMWDKHIMPESFSPDFVPRYGLLLDSSELEMLRTSQHDLLRLHGASPQANTSAKADHIGPEKRIKEYLGSGARYGRDDDPPTLTSFGLNASVAGMLARDKRLLFLAARYALSMAACEHWEDGMICSFPGGTFEHRCFTSSNCVHELSIILDLAGECFTDFGREYLLRRMAQEGLGSINFIAWKHDYVFRCNQLALFSRGRIAGYAVLEKHWGEHVSPYLELAYNELVESIDSNVLPDGGNTEGSIYCIACLGSAGMGLYYYARARGIEFASVVPDVIKRTGAFAAAILSTDERRICEYIPVSDSRDLGAKHDLPYLAMLAAMVPDSQWVTMYRRLRARTGGTPESVLTWLLDGIIPEDVPEPPPFVEMRDTCMIASTRKLGCETVKLLILGGTTGGAHSHEDKGSFVLEFAGDTYAMDPGTCQYTNPISGQFSHCERHNMLVPIIPAERPHPKNPPLTDIKPIGTGDHRVLRVRMDVSPGWEDYYRSWIREWRSPSPDVLVIRDSFELIRGDGVECYWNTQREIDVNGTIVTLTGKRSSVVIETPVDCTIRVDRLPLHNADGLATPKRDFQSRIAIRSEAKSGVIEITARLVPRVSNAVFRRAGSHPSIGKHEKLI